MKVTLYNAMSLNGFIADQTDNEEFLSDESWMDFKRLADECGCVIFGRRTYDVLKSRENYNFDDIKEVIKIIVSKTKKDFGNGFIAAGSPLEALEKAKSEGCDKVLLVGGGNLSASFMKENLVDEMIFNIDSVIIGRGIPVFSGQDFEARLELSDIKRVSEDIVQLNYEVRKSV